MDPLKEVSNLTFWIKVQFFGIFPYCMYCTYGNRKQPANAKNSKKVQNRPTLHG